MNLFHHRCGHSAGRRYHRDTPHSLEDRRHGRGGRSGRFFETGDLRLVILRLIAERPRHGYEIIKDIEERLAGAYSPSPGVVYPTLTLLEELGQIAVRSTEGGRKLYAVTPEGEAALAGSRAEAEALFARMDALAGDGPDGSVLQLKRAVHNLRNALRMRLSRGPLTQEQLHGMVAMIDEVALKVERT
ncbi:PadR family transcriptional regulator [Pararoseomonas sp. SCSIO 73927]|uniref:PadR family transcriptional regulator n=1 Tax=Pararoseomonas sp. SCSIO 73927 TaxID=3114537 RepID=UPI0030CAA90A